jgi:hypothetical protein
LARYQNHVADTAVRKPTPTALSELQNLDNRRWVQSRIAQIECRSTPRCSGRLIHVERGILRSADVAEAMIRDCWPTAKERIETMGAWITANAAHVLAGGTSALSAFDTGRHLLDSPAVPAMASIAYCGVLGALAAEHQLCRDAPFIRVLAAAQGRQQDVAQIVQALESWKGYAPDQPPDDQGELQRRIVSAIGRVAELIDSCAAVPPYPGDPRLAPALGLASHVSNSVGMDEMLKTQMTFMLERAMR